MYPFWDVLVRGDFIVEAGSLEPSLVFLSGANAFCLVKDIEISLGEFELLSICEYSF